MKIKAISVLLFLLIVIVSEASAQIAIPKLISRVTDLTETLSTQEKLFLESELTELEKEKGSQLFVLIVPSTSPEDIAQFGIRLADDWKVGRDKVDDGVILIIAKEDRALRIEVGRGLEGAIPDAVANRIIDEQIVPRFRAGDFSGGINSGVQSIIGLIRGESLPAPNIQDSSRLNSSFGPLLITGFAVSTLFVTLGLSAPVAGGLVGFACGLIAFLTTVPLWAAILLAILIFIISLGQGPGSNYSRRGGFYGNSWGGGGGWSSGSSGGFSGGGGGSFGGGGASGKW